MALQSKTISAKGSRDHHTFILTVTEDRTNVSTNESILSFTFNLVDDNNWFWSAQGTYVSYKITIGSHTYEGYIPHHTSVTTEVRSESDISELHNSDGTKTINIGFTVTDSSSIYYLPGNASASSTMALTTIPRASGVSVGNVTISSTSGSLSATINPQASFWHRWKYVIGSYDSGWTNMSSAISSATSISVAYTTILSKITASSSGTVVFTVETHNSNAFNNSSYIGTASATSTVTITLKPSAPTLTTLGFRSRSSGVNSNITTPTAGYTTVALTSWSNGTSSGATSYTTYFSVDQGASLKTTSATANNTVIETNTLPASAKQYTLTYTAYTVDSRGNKSSNATKTVAVYGYSTPTLNLTAYRVANGSSTTEDATGTKAYVTFSNNMRGQTDTNGALLRTGNQNAIISAVCKYGNTTVTSGAHIDLAIENTLTFTYTVQDRFTTTSTTRTVNSASFPLDLYDNGSGTVGVGLGTVAMGNRVKFGLPLVSANNQIGIVLSDVDNNDCKAIDSSLTSSSTDEAWFSALLKAICVKYPNKSGYLFKGLLSPNSMRWYEIYIYDTSIVQNGYPRYSFGNYYSYGSGDNKPRPFGTTDYTFYWHDGIIARWANGASEATIANNFTVTDTNVSSSTTYYPVWVAGRTSSTGYAPRVNDGFLYRTREGSSSQLGYAIIYVGNAIANGTAGNKKGMVRLHSSDATYTDIEASPNGNGYSAFLPNAPATTYMLGERTLWSNTLKGGNTLSLDVSAWARIRVYAKLYAINAIYEIDLSTTNAYEQISGYRYSGGATVPEFTASGGLEYLVSQCLVSTDKKTIYHYHCGYQAVGSGYTDRNDNNNYFIYKIVGLASY